MASRPDRSGVSNSFAKLPLALTTEPKGRLAGMGSFAVVAANQLRPAKTPIALPVVGAPTSAFRADPPPPPQEQPQRRVARMPTAYPPAIFTDVFTSVGAAAGAFAGQLSDLGAMAVNAAVALGSSASRVATTAAAVPRATAPGKDRAAAAAVDVAPPPPRALRRAQSAETAYVPKLAPGQENTRLFVYPHPAALAAWTRHPNNVSAAFAEAMAEAAASEAAAAAETAARSAGEGASDSDDSDILEISTVARPASGARRLKREPEPAVTEGADGRAEGRLDGADAAASASADLGAASAAAPAAATLPGEAKLPLPAPAKAAALWNLQGMVTVTLDDLARTEPGEFLNDSCIDWVSGGRGVG